eukprot:jgi/Astpho2/3149/Aster-x1126
MASAKCFSWGTGQATPQLVQGLLHTGGCKSVQPSPAGQAQPRLSGSKSLFTFCRMCRYIHQLEGVVLSYANLKLLAKHGLIHVYFPFFRASVTADVTLFRPRAGQVMVGKVNVLGQDYISLLVLDIFNVTISRTAIRQELAPLQGVEGGCWQSSEHSKHQILATSEVRFKVVKIHDSAQYFGLDGSLQDADTGCTSYLERAARKKRKRAEAAGHSHGGTSEAAAPVKAAAAPVKAVAAPAAQATGNPAGKAAKPLRAVPEPAAARPKSSKAAQPASRADAAAASRQAASMASEPEQPKKKRRKAAQDLAADAAVRQAPAAAAVAAEKQGGKHKGSPCQRPEAPQQRAVAGAPSVSALSASAQQNGREEEHRDPPPKKKKKKHKEAAQINGLTPAVQVSSKKRKKTKPH